MRAFVIEATDKALRSWVRTVEDQYRRLTVVAVRYVVMISLENVTLISPEYLRSLLRRWQLVKVLTRQAMITGAYAIAQRMVAVFLVLKQNVNLVPRMAQYVE